MKQFCCSLLLVLISNIAFSQITSPVTPQNYGNVADEIVDWYELHPNFNLTTNQIKNFFSSQLANVTYQSSCTPPAPSVEDMDATSITVGWAASPGATKYRVGYINLGTGDSDYIAVTSPDTVLNNLSDGLYLISLQAYCGNHFGPLDIIIADKPILYSDLTDGCNCAAPATWIDASSQEEDYVFEPWPGVDQEEIFEIRVFFTENDYSWPSETTILINHSEQIVYVAPTCTKNMAVSNRTTMFHSTSPGESSDYEAYFSFSDGFFFDPTMFTTAQGNSWNIKVDKCRKPTTRPGKYSGIRSASEENTSIVDAQCRPNPAGHQTLLTYQLPEDSQVALSLYDAYGQKVRLIQTLQWELAGAHQHNIDLSDLPAGFYYLSLQGPEQSQMLPIVKAKNN